MPRSFAGAKTGAYPARDAPYPPARYLGVMPLCGTFQRRSQFIALAEQPRMPRMDVILVHWVVRPRCCFAWRVSDRAPEIGNEPVQVVNGLVAPERRRPAEEDCATPEKWLDVVSDFPEARPDFGGDLTFATEPWEWRVESRHLVTS